MLYATILACWMGMGCFLFVSDETFSTDEACQADISRLLGVITEKYGPPLEGEASCVNKEGLTALFIEQGLDPGDIQ